MKTTAIWIIIAINNSNIVYNGLVNSVKNEIRKYFGTENIKEDSEEFPVISLTCEVTQDDINAIKRIIDHESVSFAVIVGAEDSQRVSGDIINLID